MCSYFDTKVAPVKQKLLPGYINQGLRLIIVFERQCGLVKITGVVDFSPNFYRPGTISMFKNNEGTYEEDNEFIY